MGMQFQDSMHHVASTREAILLDVIGIKNLTNIRRGTYYGGVKYYLLKLMKDCMSQHVTAVFREDMQQRLKTNANLLNY